MEVLEIQQRHLEAKLMVRLQSRSHRLYLQPETRIQGKLVSWGEQGLSPSFSNASKCSECKSKSEVAVKTVFHHHK